VAPESSTSVLVTGASGFVGLNCVEHILRLGNRVVAVSSDDVPAEARAEFATLPGELLIVRADVTDAPRLREIVANSGVEVLIHGAAITANDERSRSEGDRVIDVNIQGTQNVLDAAARTGSIRRIVYISSAAVYGGATFDSLRIDEATPPDPRTLYGITKLAGEMLTRRHGELHGTEVVAARLSAVFGPWERDTGVRDLLSPLYQLSRAARSGTAVALPEHDAGRNWLYSRDAASALARLSVGALPQHFLYNVAPSSTFKVEAWAQRLEAAYPAWRVAGGREEGGALSFDTDPSRRRTTVSNDRLQAEMTQWPRYEPNLAFDDCLSWLDRHEDWP